MKKEKILKIIVVLILGVTLLAMSTRVFAAVGDSDGLMDLYDDTTNQLNTTNTNNTNTNTNLLNTNTLNTNKLNTNKNITNTTLNTNNYNTNLPKAGAAENKMLGVAFTVLAITAVYAYKKVKEYKNI